MQPATDAPLFQPSQQAHLAFTKYVFLKSKPIQSSSDEPYVVVQY